MILFEFFFCILYHNSARNSYQLHVDYMTATNWNDRKLDAILINADFSISKTLELKKNLLIRELIKLKHKYREKLNF